MQAAASSELIIQIPIGLIEVKKNVRTTMKKGGLKELAGSIEQDGILEPLLVLPKNGKKYELIAGARRLVAGGMAKLKTVPAIVKDVDEKTAHRFQLIENLQREDLHDIDAGGAYRGLLETGLTVAEIGRQVGKPDRDIRQRLELTQLILPAAKAFRNDELTFGHAFAIARLDEALQPAALAACHKLGRHFDQESGKWVVAVKGMDTLVSVGDLERWIAEHTQQALARASWDLDDATVLEFAEKPLVNPPKAPSCSKCPYNTANDVLLFADLAGENLCTLPQCFANKQSAVIAQKMTELASEQGKALSISTAYSTHGEKVMPGTLTSDNYRVVDKAKPCKLSQKAVLVHLGNQRDLKAKVGEVVEVCTSNTCQVHMPQGVSSTRTERKTPAGFAARKQELFEQKVSEEVRQRVIKEAAGKVRKIDRVLLIQIAAKLFSELDAKRLVLKLMNWSTVKVEKAAEDRFSTASDEQLIVQMRLADKKLTDKELAQFIYLCGIIDTGLHTWRGTKEALPNLAKQWQVNQPLHDAEARVAFSLKKHRTAHEEYLAQVQKKKKGITPPKVFIDSQKEKQAANKPTLKLKDATKKAAPKKKATKAKPATKGLDFPGKTNSTVSTKAAAKSPGEERRRVREARAKRKKSASV